jgi:hypothetical protein
MTRIRNDGFPIRAIRAIRGKESARKGATLTDCSAKDVYRFHVKTFDLRFIVLERADSPIQKDIRDSEEKGADYFGEKASAFANPPSLKLWRTVALAEKQC